jgi:hypothetical protein
MKLKPATLLPLMFLLATAGCAHQSVYHLKRVPLATGSAEQQVELDYWRFSYTTIDSNEGIRVEGVAFPKKSAIPVWATWVDDLWMEAYLSDQRGHILARHLKVFDSRALDFQAGVPFQFTLKPVEMGSPGHVYTTFGYRMVLSRSASEHPGSAPSKKEVFFASEGALTRY